MKPRSPHRLEFSRGRSCKGCQHITNGHRFVGSYQSPALIHLLALRNAEPTRSEPDLMSEDSTYFVSGVRAQSPLPYNSSIIIHTCGFVNFIGDMIDVLAWLTSNKFSPGLLCHPGKPDWICALLNVYLSVKTDTASIPLVISKPVRHRTASSESG